MPRSSTGATSAARTPPSTYRSCGAGLPPDARGELLSAYGPVGEELLLRARVLALFLGAALALYAHHERLIDLERDAIGGLDRACRE